MRHPSAGGGSAAPAASARPTMNAGVDRLASLVRRVLRAPVALVSIIGSDTVALPGAAGLPEPWQTTRSTPHDLSFCRFVAADDTPLRITDARRHPDLAHTGAVTQLGVVAYCGVPLTTDDGTVIGALCAIDTEPREWTDDDVAVLTDLAATAVDELALRSETLVAQAGQQNAQDRSDAIALLLTLSEALSGTETALDIAAAVEQAARTTLGTLRVQLTTVDGRGPAVPGDARTPETWVATHRRPLFLPDAATARASFPDARQDGASAHLPVEVAGELLGTMSLTWSGPREFDSLEQAPLLALARYTAQATARAQLLAERRSVATALQEAMLTDLPTTATGELAARYLAANTRNQVGGDWYDAFVTADGALALAIGDVTGHDLAAAAHMGQLRSMLRAYAWPGELAPAGVLTRLDRATVGLGIGVLATALVVRVDPADPATGASRVRWSNAGHPAPLTISADGDVQVRHTPADLLLGVDPERPRTEHTLDLLPGDTLLLVTDGLVERGRVDLDLGTDRLVDLARAAADRPLPELLADLVEGGGEDDIAVLGLRVPHRVG